ncbi:MAG: hypothetical protein ACKVOQ_08775 [Cyclobacteriaceae bacterium]
MATLASPVGSEARKNSSMPYGKSHTTETPAYLSGRKKSFAEKVFYFHIEPYYLKT